MENKRQASITPVEPEKISDYAVISHQKGDVQMITTTRDKVEALLSASNSLSSNFFTLMIGTVITIFIALKSGGIEESWKSTFWLAFYFSLVLTAYFGFNTFRDEMKKRRLKREVIKDNALNNSSQDLLTR